MLPISFMSQMKQGQIERLASSTIPDASGHHKLVVIMPPALTEDECSVLSKGLNFKGPPNKLFPSILGHKY